MSTTNTSPAFSTVVAAALSAHARPRWPKTTDLAQNMGVTYEIAERAILKAYSLE